jgi:hypothetical protein
MFNLNIKDNFKRVIALLSEPKTLAVIQLVGAAVTVLHAANKLRATFNDENHDA